MTGRQPRYRNLAAPARFAARWRRLAACHGMDLNLFYPERGESAEPARQVCAPCPVRQPCLACALSNRITRWPGHIHAVWELSTLAAEWHHVYGGERPDLARALEFYDRWLPGTMRRVAAITRSCVPECAMHRHQW